MSNKSTHVVPNTKGGWDVKQSGGQRSSDTLILSTKQFNALE